MVANVDTFNPSFKSSDFKTPEQPKWIGRLEDIQLRDTPADYKEKYPDTPDQQIVQKWRPLSYRPREGEHRYENMSLSFSKNGKLYKHIQSAAVVRNQEFADFAEFKSYMLGKAFEVQAVPTSKRDNSPQYLHVHREVSDAEAATVQPRGPQPATADGQTVSSPSQPSQQAVDTSPAAVEALALELVGEFGDEGGTYDALRQKMLADERFRGNRVLVAGVFTGELLHRLKDDGRLTLEDGVFRRG